MGRLRCATASVAAASLLGSEPRQHLPPETVAVGQLLLHGEKPGGLRDPASLPARYLPLSCGSCDLRLLRSGWGASSRDSAGRGWGDGVAEALPTPGPLTPCLGLAPQVTMCDRKAVIKNADMSEEMQQDSVECATQALEKYNIEKDIAAHIKKVRRGSSRTWFSSSSSRVPWAPGGGWGAQGGLGRRAF